MRNHVTLSKNRFAKSIHMIKYGLSCVQCSKVFSFEWLSTTVSSEKCFLFIDDQVYLHEQDLLNEYILNDKGRIYVGNQKSMNGRKWNFGQVHIVNVNMIWYTNQCSIDIFPTFTSLSQSNQIFTKTSRRDKLFMFN